MIQQTHKTSCVQRLCTLLKVSRSGYYAWRNRRPACRQHRREQLLQAIRRIHQDSGGRYGAPRIHQQLRAEGIPCCLNTVAGLMRQEGMRSAVFRRFVACTTDSRHGYGVAPNLLERQFAVQALNRIWTADITYIATQEGWLYLAAVMDLCSRRIVGWSMAEPIRAELALEALRMAIHERRPGPGLIHHSDRGVQYACEDYQDVLARHAMRCSMSGKGNCYDNAPMESFFGKYKTEAVYLQERYPTREAARHHAFEYIEIFYNRERRHSTLGYLSPVAFEERLR